MEGTVHGRWIVVLASALLLACGNTKTRGHADGSGDADEVEAVDSPVDPRPDGGDPFDDPDAAADTWDPDTAEDTTEDPDAAEDTAFDPDVVADTMEDPDAAVDATTDPDAAMDTAGDPDAAMDTGADLDASMDTAGDPDGSMDTADDPDGSMDTAGDPDGSGDTGGDPDAAGDTGVDPDASTDTVWDPDVSVDTSIDSVDVVFDSTCGGTPYILTMRKGPEYTSACNPDGSTTEALAASDLGGCCVSVDHYCAWLNCCSRLTASLHPPSTPWTIDIRESEIGPFCTCDGWFSPSYVLCGLSAGTWTIWIGSLSVPVVVSP
jgi:hypothetical protein